MRASIRTARVALLTAVALIIYVVESYVVIIPPLPFFRLGLSNVVIMFTLIWCGKLEAFGVLAVRNVAGAIFAGNVQMLMYSMPASVIALVVLLLTLPLLKRVSLTALSVVSSIVHNFVQLSVFCLVSESVAPLAYFPYLSVLGAIAGAITGLIVFYTVKSLPETVE